MVAHEPRSWRGRSSTMSMPAVPVAERSKGARAAPPTARPPSIRVVFSADRPVAAGHRIARGSRQGRPRQLLELGGQLRFVSGAAPLGFPDPGSGRTPVGAGTALGGTGRELGQHVGVTLGIPGATLGPRQNRFHAFVAR